MNYPLEVKNLFALFTQNNKHLYIIGGAVRDDLLKKEVKDYDFTTDATPNEMLSFLKDYKLDTYQQTLGSIKVHIQNNVYEITTMRKETGVKDYRYPETITFTTSLKEDVQRRDFTINALAYDENSNLYDYTNGKEDLENKTIRFIGDAKTRIIEDPIRILRALRFAKTLDFHLANGLDELFIQESKSISSLGLIRFMELDKLFHQLDYQNFIQQYLTIYQNAFPEIKDWNEILKQEDWFMSMKELLLQVDPILQEKILSVLDCTKSLRKQLKQNL